MVLALAAAYAAAERMADAKTQVGEILRIDPGYAVAEWVPHIMRFRESKHLNRIMFLPRQAGLPE